MRTFKDAKAMARTLGDELSGRGVNLQHGICLDIVARQFGLDDWNTLAAKLVDKPPLSSATAAGRATALTLPTGWRFEGSRLDFDAGVDATLRHGAGHPAVIRSRFSLDQATYARDRSGLGALVQELDATAYKGKRLRLQADLRTEAVVGAATIWLQVDRTRHRDVLVLDNMEQRAKDGALTGTQEWTTRRIILDVPMEAGVVHYGFYLRGSGTVWAGDFDLREAADGEAPTNAPDRLPSEPVNLAFAQLEHPVG